MVRIVDKESKRKAKKRRTQKGDIIPKKKLRKKLQNMPREKRKEMINFLNEAKGKDIKIVKKDRKAKGSQGEVIQKNEVLKPKEKGRGYAVMDKKNR